MQAKYKWLLLPPALAVVLVLGPLSGDGSRAASKAAETAAEPGSAAVDLPSLWQVGSTLLGVLLLAAVGLMVFARLRSTGTSTGPGPIVQLRQSLRLGAKGRLHAVQFDGRMLLLGETEGRITLLREGEDPDAAEDAHEVESRIEEEGAVPRDLRDDPAPRAPAARTTAEPQLADFKALLRRARSEKVS